MSSAVATPIRKQRAPTLYVIIATKLLKGSFFLALAITSYVLSDNNLPVEFHKLLHWLHWNPERKFFVEVGEKIGSLTEANLLWASALIFLYSLFSLVEGFGLILRISWAGWLAIGESVLFIPIEVYDLLHKFSWKVFAILVINIVIVWYLLKNRQRLFHH